MYLEDFDGIFVRLDQKPSERLGAADLSPIEHDDEYVTSQNLILSAELLNLQTAMLGRWYVAETRPVENFFWQAILGI